MKLTKELAIYKEKYAKEVREHQEDVDEALRKNKALAQELRDLPKKVTELARQNKKLIQETSRMHYNLGVFFTRQRDYRRALTEFKKAVEIEPSDAYSHFNLGYIYAEYLVNREKAVEHFRKFLNLAEADDEDTEWVKRYLLTWETYGGKEAMK